MKIKILLLFFVVSLSSCSVQEDRMTAIQSNIDDKFFGAEDIKAVEHDDGTFSIQGVTYNQKLTLNIEGPQTGTYSLSGNEKNYATYVSDENVTYHTNPHGEGKVVVTNWDSTNKILSGRFDFTAVIPGVDTLSVTRGVFNNVSYGFPEVIVEPIEEEPIFNDGFFSAEVDDVDFTPISVSAVNNDDSIVIKGRIASESISLTVPASVSSGGYSISNTGFLATFSVGENIEEGIEGRIIVISHNVVERRIRGSFGFETENHSISFGQFNVVY